MSRLLKLSGFFLLICNAVTCAETFEQSFQKYKEKMKKTARGQAERFEQECENDVDILKNLVAAVNQGDIDLTKKWYLDWVFTGSQYVFFSNPACAHFFRGSFDYNVVLHKFLKRQIDLDSERALNAFRPLVYIMYNFPKHNLAKEGDPGLDIVIDKELVFRIDNL